MRSGVEAKEGMQDLWNVFLTTGKVSDYLAFRDSIGEGSDREPEADKADAPHPEEVKGEAWERTC